MVTMQEKLSQATQGIYQTKRLSTTAHGPKTSIKEFMVACYDITFRLLYPLLFFFCFE